MPSRCLRAPLPRHFVALAFGAILVSIVLSAPGAVADTVAYSGTINGAARVASVETHDVDGIEYVPLLDLVTQLGGGFNLLFSRVQVEIAGKSAYVPFNAREIEGASGRFSLLRPVVRAEQEVLVAREDVPTLFGKGFELVVNSGGPTASVPIAGPGSTPAPVAPTAPRAPQPEVVRKIATVIIDPGHGGLDRGVTGRSVQESELTLAVANTVRNVLGNAGFQVLLTREEDTNRSIAERAQFANNRKGDLLIALHAGASFAPNAHGLEIFYPTAATPLDVQQAAVARAHPYRDRSQRFAQILAETVRDTAQAEIRGIHGAQLRLYATVTMPGIVLEIGVITNPADEALLEKDAYHQGIAQAILAAIQRFNDETSTP